MKIEYEGKFTAGYYNSMEAGHPVFIDGDAVDEIIKDKLLELGLDCEFSYYNERDSKNVKNPLIGKKVKLILEIEEE